MRGFPITPTFPEKEVWLELVGHVKNAAELRESTIKGDLQACLVDPQLILDPFQILVATNKALHSESIGKLKTRSLYSEVLFNLSPTNKMNASLSTFGIGEETTEVLVVVIGSEADANTVVNMIGGSPINLSLLHQMADKEKIKKVYKLNDCQECLLSSVLTAMAIKDVK